MTKTERKRLRAMRTLDEVHCYLDAEAAKRRSSGARLRSREPRASGRTKAERDAAKAANLAAIRAYVDRRDDVCVICLQPAPGPWELHHVDSGSGKSQRQTKRNCCKTHERCHKQAHGGVLVALWALVRWARAYGYGETEAVLERRIAKVDEARRPPSVPIRVEVRPEHRCLFGATVCTHAQCQHPEHRQEDTTP